jgi:hypothetical protein
MNMNQITEATATAAPYDSAVAPCIAQPTAEGSRPGQVLSVSHEGSQGYAAITGRQDLPELPAPEKDEDDEGSRAYLYECLKLKFAGLKAGTSQAVGDSKYFQAQLSLQQEEIEKNHASAAARQADIEKKEKDQSITSWILSAIGMVVAIVMIAGSGGTAAPLIGAIFGLLFTSLDLANNITHTFFKDATMVNERGEKVPMDLAIGTAIDQIMAAMVRADPPLIQVEGINDSPRRPGVPFYTQESYNALKTGLSIALNVIVMLIPIGAAARAGSQATKAAVKIAETASDAVSKAAVTAGEETLKKSGTLLLSISEKTMTMGRAASTAGTGASAITGGVHGGMGIDLADTRKALADTEIEGKSLQGDVQITRTRFNVEQSNMKAAMDFTTLMANAIAEFMKGSNDPMLGIAARIRTA